MNPAPQIDTTPQAPAPQVGTTASQAVTPASPQPQRADPAPKPQVANQPAPEKPAAVQDPAPNDPAEKPYINHLFDAILGKSAEDPKSKADKPAAEPDPKVTQTPSPKPEPKLEPKPEDAPKDPPARKKVQRVGPKPRTDEDIASVAAAAATRALQDQQKSQPQESTEPKKPADDIPEMFSRKAEVFRALAEVDPAQYGDGKIQKLLRQSATQIEEYKKAWERENTGKKFDPRSPEHQETIAELSPDIPDDDMQDARARLVARRMVEEQVRPLREELEVRKAAEQRERAMAEITTASTASADRIVQGAVSGFDPEIAKASMTTDSWKQFREANPAQSEMVESVVAAHIPIANRAVQILLPGGATTIDPKSLVDVRVIAELYPAIDRHVLEGPDEGVDPEGRQYVPIGKFVNMTRAQQQGHWTITPKLVEDYTKQVVTRELKAANQKMISDFEAKAKSFGFVKQVSQPTPAQKTAPAETPVITAPSPSPTTSSGGPAIGSGKAVKNEESTVDMLYRNIMNGQ